MRKKIPEKAILRPNKKTGRPESGSSLQAQKHIRPSWDEYFMSIAEIVGSRATCDRGRSGCVIVKDKRVLVSGYVGSPVGLPHCDEVGHEMHKVTHEDGSETHHCIRTIHAEQNAVAQAARMGISLDGSTVYCKMVPCYTCAKILMNAGIMRIVAAKDYQASSQSKKIFKEGGIILDILNPEVEAYPEPKSQTKSKAKSV